MIKLITFIILFCTMAHADLAVKYGVGVFQSAKDSNSEVKVLAVSYQESLFLDYVIKQYEFGFWVDPRQDLQRVSSGFGSYSVGVHVNAAGTYAQALWGIGGITNTDSYLGGNFQFNHDLALGFRDNNGATVGLNYKHISSAGIYQPNVGRDFLMLRLSVPW